VSKRRIAAVGSGVTSVLAAASGVAGGHLTRTVTWAFVAFISMVVLGAVLTGWLVIASDDGSPKQPPEDGDAPEIHRVGPVTARNNGQAVGINYGSVSRGDPQR
jgi:hypothetical protein